MDEEGAALVVPADEEGVVDVAFRVVWADSAPLTPIEGEPGFVPGDEKPSG